MKRERPTIHQPGNSVEGGDSMDGSIRTPGDKERRNKFKKTGLNGGNDKLPVPLMNVYFSQGTFQCH
jgi:hypothetical protein